MSFTVVRAVLLVVVPSILFGCNSAPPSSASASPPRPAANASTPTSQPANPREAKLAQAFASFLRTQHVQAKPIDDALSQKSFERFIEALDPSKLYLLSSDVTRLKAFEDKFDDDLLSGNLRVAHEANDILLGRLKVVQDLVAKRLGKPFDFDVAETHETDPDKLPFAKSDEELGERWRKVLKLEALGRVTRMKERREALVEAIEKAKATPGKDRNKERKKPLTNEELEDTEGKKLDVLEKALAKIPATDAEQIKKVQEDMEKSYSARFTRLVDVEDLAPVARFLNSIAEAFDPHTLYMAPSTKENFDIQMSGSLEGIGAVLVEQEHFIGVREIVAGGASWRQGELEVGDLILAVAQDGQEPVEIGDMRINKVVQMIRGPKGTTVTLTVEKSDGTVKNISIVREKIEIESAYAQGAVLQAPGSSPVGYIYLPSFYGNTRGRVPGARESASDVQALLSRFSKRKLPGVIIDVRSNGGGLLEDSRRMSGFFIDKGPIVQTQLPDGTVDVLKDEGESFLSDEPSIVYSGEVIVLVDQFSASASEILAAALQDYKRAVIVGPGPTHGKGTVQALLDLSRANERPDDPPLGVLKLTIQQFYRINGASTQWKGVTPDISFPSEYKYLDTGERNLDNSLPWTSIKPVPHTDWTKSKWDLTTLREKSLARQQKDKYFTRVESRAKLLKQRRDDTVMPLRRTDFETRLKKQREELEAHTTKVNNEKPHFSVKIVHYAKSNGSESDKAAKDKDEAWRKSLAQDANLNETLHIMADMLL